MSFSGAKGESPTEQLLVLINRTLWALYAAFWISVLICAAVVAAIVSRQGRIQSAGALPSLIGASIAGSLWIPQQIILYDAIGLEFGILFISGIAALLLTALPLAAAPADVARPVPSTDESLGREMQVLE